MARGRFLSRDVSTSEKLADLPSHFARLLWSWLVPHTDRDGRLDGRARVIKAQVVPMLEETVADVEAALSLLAVAGLIDRYRDAAGQSVAQVIGFSDHQHGMRYKREQPSKFGSKTTIGVLKPEASGVKPDNAVIADITQLQPTADMKPAPVRPKGNLSGSNLSEVGNADDDGSVDHRARAIGTCIAGSPALAAVVADPVAYAEGLLPELDAHMRVPLDEILIGIREASQDTPSGDQPDKVLKRIRTYVTGAIRRFEKNPRTQPLPAPPQLATPADYAANAAAEIAELERTRPRRTAP